MSDRPNHELAEKSRQILDEAKRLPANAQIDGLRKKGIIDSQGQLIPRTNGNSSYHPDPSK